MIAMTGLAFICGLASALPTFFTQALVGMIWIAATGWLVTGLFFARGDQRAFCIGAAVVVSSMWSRLGGRFIQGMLQMVSGLSGGLFLSEAISAWLDLTLIAGAAVANGWLCIRARHYFEQQSSN